MDRLGLYVPHFDGQPAGLGTYVNELAPRLAQRAAVAYLFTETPDQVPPALREVTRVEPLPAPRARVARLAARHAYVTAGLPRRLVALGCEALFVPVFGGMPFPSVPQVVVVHDLTPLVVPSGYFHPLQGTFLRTVLPQVLRRSTVVAVSENTKRDVVREMRVPPSRVRVVGEGFARDVFRPRAEREVATLRARLGLTEPYLFYSGTYARHKNTPLLAEILDGLAQRGRPHVLALGGRLDAGNASDLGRALAARGLEGRVRRLGYVDRGDLAGVMQGAEAFVFPSLYEGFGLAPLEAMAAGALVLASDRASLPEVVGDGGLLLDPRHAAPWVEAILRAEREPTWSGEVRARGLSRALTFDWDAAADQLFAILQRAR